jgi:FAD/FMN-containing dehydrogenase
VPRAAAARTAWLTLAEAGAFARLVGRARALCLGSLAALEFIDRAAVDALREARPDLALPHPDAPWHVLVECEAATAAIAEAPLFALVEAALTDGLAVDAVVAQDERDRQRLWRLREALPEAIGRLGRVRRYDVAVAVPEVVGLVGAVRTALADGGLPARPVAYGHAAEGNVHLNVVVAAAPDTALEAALDAVVYGEVLARGGTISAEHGVGRLKRDHLGAMRSPAELAFMTALKALCDPAGILNPDVLLPPGEGRS